MTSRTSCVSSPSALRALAGLALAAAGALLGGCSVPASPGSDDASARDVAGPEFGAEQKRAARLLSIGNVAALNEATDPYRQAVLCSVSTDSFLKRLRESGALSTEQLAVVERLRLGFERRARQLKPEGASIEADSAAVLDGNSSQELGRIALGCLQRSV